LRGVSALPSLKIYGEFNVTQIANGEAVSIASMMAAHNVAEAALNAAGPSDDTDELNRHFRRSIKDLQDPRLECRSPADAVAVLRYVKEASGEDDVMVDALLPLVIGWLESLTCKRGMAGHVVIAEA
jgi:hypothetical protein